LSQNHLAGLYCPPVKGFGYGFAVIMDDTSHREVYRKGQLYWGRYFRTHFFIYPANRLVGILMTEKLPFNNKYEKALKRLSIVLREIKKSNTLQIRDLIF